MVTKNKDEYVQARVGKEIKARIQGLVDAGEYENESVFVRKAVLEKLDGVKREEITKKELVDLKLRDPAFFRTLLE